MLFAMTTAALIALMAAIFSIAVKVIGMPSQIIHNYERKSTAGLSNSFLLFTLISYCMWVMHGLQVHDMSLVIGQGLGVIATAVIVGQAIAYRKTNPTKSKPAVLWYTTMFNKKERLHGRKHRQTSMSSPESNLPHE